MPITAWLAVATNPSEGFSTLGSAPNGTYLPVQSSDFSQPRAG